MQLWGLWLKNLKREMTSIEVVYVLSSTHHKTLLNVEQLLCSDFQLVTCLARQHGVILRPSKHLGCSTSLRNDPQQLQSG